jgi:hypothetical protein
MENSAIIEKFLVERGLNEPKKTPTKETVLEDDELLAKIANIDPVALHALIEGRIDYNREELVMRAVPAEVFVLRQIMLELSEVMADHETYRIENERRIKERDAKAVTEPVVAQPIEDSSVSSESSV